MDLCMHARTHMWQITNTDANCLFISFNTIFFLLSCVLHFQIKAKTKTAVTPCHTTIFSDKIDSNRKIIWILYSSSHLWSAHARMFRNNAKHTAVWHGNRLNRHTHTSNKNRIMSVSLEISVFSVLSTWFNLYNRSNAIEMGNHTYWRMWLILIWNAILFDFNHCSMILHSMQKILKKNYN